MITAYGPPRFDFINDNGSSIGTVYLNHIEYPAENISLNVEVSDDGEIVYEMGGKRHYIPPHRIYTVTIDGMKWDDPEVFFWPDAEAYLASKQYVIEEMELP